MKRISLLLVSVLFFALTSVAASKVAPYKIGFNISITSINEDRMKRASQAGIEYIEVGNVMAHFKGDMSPEQIKQEYLRIKDLLDKYGIKVWSIHMPFRDGMDLALLDEDARRKVIDKDKEILPYVALFKPQIVLFHPGGVSVAEKRDEFRAQSVKSAIELAAAVEKIGAKIVIENMLNKPLKDGKGPTLCATLEDMKVLMAAMPKNIFVAIDVNHAKDPQDYIAYFGERVKSLHISDCDKGGVSDCHFMPGLGTLDYVAIMSALNKAKYQGVYMHELSETQYSKDYNVLVNSYNSYYEKFIKTLE